MATADLEIVTPRLRLKAGTVGLLEAAINDHPRLEPLLGVAVPDIWPPADNLDFLHAVLDALRRDASLLGWGPWLVVCRAERTLVGDAGFKGRPGADGQVEIGYGIVPAYWKRGYATEAVRGLIGWAFEQGVRAVTAETEDTNVASQRVLEKNGLRQIRREGSMLNWRVERD